LNTYGPVKIYTLSDPHTEEIRYVGKTVETLNKRLSKHTSNIKNLNEKNHRAFWIKSLVQKGLKPIIRLIEEVPFEIWEEREKYWIKYYRDLGLNLVNSTDGGDTCNPDISSKVLKKLWKDPVYRYFHSGKYHHAQREEWKEKMRGDRNLIKRLTKEQEKERRAKISKSEIGHPAYPNQQKAASESNSKPKTLKHRLALSKAKRKLSKETIDKVRKERKSGNTYIELATKYNVSITAIFRIVNFKYIGEKEN
jgi:hypothetical protein